MSRLGHIGDAPKIVFANMSVRGGPGGMVHQPIHESLTLSALISAGAGVPPGTNVDNATDADWEYIRGAVWNDDPDLLLFDDSEDQNHDYSTLKSGKWLYWYNQGKSEWTVPLGSSRLKNVTGRSHYGDLQFLHAMAFQSGEQPAETKRKIMVWLEVMYKLANGEDDIAPETKMGNTKLSEFCPVLALPPSFKSLSYMLAKDSPFKGLDIRRRALGSMLHIIQDSYALGHTRRTPLNPQDKASDNPLTFQPGKADQWGAIENFHTYGGQDGHAHSHFDHNNDSIPDSGHLENLDQWNGLIGCRMAAEKCKDLLILKQSGKKWDDSVRKFLDEDVFAISPNATPANNQV